MTSSLFRKLLLMALLLVAATLFAVDYTLTRSIAAIPPAQVRERILAISLGSALLTILIAFLVSRSLSLRIRRLKLLVEGFPGGARHDRLIEDSSDELTSLETSLSGVAIELQRLLDR